MGAEKISSVQHTSPNVTSIASVGSRARTKISLLISVRQKARDVEWRQGEWFLRSISEIVEEDHCSRVSASYHFKHCSNRFTHNVVYFYNWVLKVHRNDGWAQCLTRSDFSVSLKIRSPWRLRPSSSSERASCIWHRKCLVFSEHVLFNFTPIDEHPQNQRLS